MLQTDVMRIFQEAILLALEISAPILITSLAIGLLVSIFQAMTQINEQTLVFIPKILGVSAALLVFGSWMLTRITDYTVALFNSIQTFIR